MVAEGSVDIAAEPELELYDMAALDVIVREAGGRFTGARRPRRAHTAATRWPATASCTRPSLGFLGAVGEERAARHEELDPDLEPGDAEGRGGTVFDLSSRRRPESPARVSAGCGC